MQSPGYDNYLLRRLKWHWLRTNLMPIDRKKRMLVPLGTPRQPSPSARVVVSVLRPPLLVLRFIFGNLYKLCFGWLDRRVARQNERRFADDIGRHLSFLFTEHKAQIIPNQGTPFPPGFDGAYVTVAVGVLRLRFVRGRGDFGVSVASEFAPQDWEDFRLVADNISEWDTSQPRPYSYSLETFEGVLRPRVAGLQEALSKERFDATLNRAVRAHNESVEEYAAKLRQWGVIPKISPSHSKSDGQL